MRRMAQAIVDELDELRETIAGEQARPRTEVATLELLVAIDALKWVAHDGAGVLGGRRVGVHRSLSLTKRARIAYEPYGVVGVIGAGSAPFAQPLGQIAGALLAGNGVVFKPARRASLAAERIARVLARAGLPEGLVRVVHGGADVGLELARAPVDKLLFTGSPATGRAVARECVSQEKEVTVELGGKDAMLVLADAHVARAAAGALWAGCAGAGQARGAVERIYAAPEVTERLVARLVAGARAMTVGDPSDPRVQIGPLASERRLAHVRELVEEAVAQGATLHCGGPVGRGAGSASRRGGGIGAFYAPAVLTGVTHEMRADARADRRPGARRDERRLGLGGDRAGQRQPLRPRRVGVDGRPLPRDAHRARARRGHGVAQRPPAEPCRLARSLGRGRRQRPGAHARRGRTAGVRAGEADHLGPLGRARPVVGPLRRSLRPCRPDRRAVALDARGRSRSSAGARAAAGAGGSRRAAAA